MIGSQKIGGNDLSEVSNNSVEYVSHQKISKIGGDMSIFLGGPLEFPEFSRSYLLIDRIPSILKTHNYYKFRPNSGNFGNYTLHAKGTMSFYARLEFKAESDDVLVLGGHAGFYTTSGAQMFLHAHDNTIISSQKEIRIISERKITIAVGKSSLTIESDAVTIKSPKINLE